MHIYSDKIDLYDCADLASETGVALYNESDNGFITRGPRAGKRKMSLTLRPISETHRAKRDGRRLWAVDWEGHREFMSRVFVSDPDAEIDSALARYRGVDEFDRLYPLTANSLNANQDGGWSGKVMA